MTKPPGKVSAHLLDLIRRQIDQSGIVVWYDPQGNYRSFVESLPPEELPGVSRELYGESFIALRRRIEPLLSGEERPRLLKIYRLSLFNGIFQERTKVDLLEDYRIHSEIFCYKLISFFELHLLQEMAWQLQSSTIVNFSKRHIIVSHFTHYSIYYFGQSMS